MSTRRQELVKCQQELDAKVSEARQAKARLVNFLFALNDERDFAQADYESVMDDWARLTALRETIKSLRGDRQALANG